MYKLSTLAAAEDMVKVTDTSLLFDLSQGLVVDAPLLSTASKGLLSGNTGEREVGNIVRFRT